MNTPKAASPKRTSKKKSTRKPKVVEHPLSSESLFSSREIGWLNFNRRVLAEAEDARNPLLERVKFLSISGSNLDEFFMKRVGGLKRHMAYGVSAKSSDGKTPMHQLQEIRQFVIPMIQDQAHAYNKVLKPALEKEGIHLLSWKDLSDKEKESVKKYYNRNVFPVLTPLSVDPGHPFPFISNLSISLGVTLKHPGSEEKLFARVKIPKVLPQWIRTDAESKDYRFISLLDVIKENLADLFPAMQVLGVMPFRLTRNADSDQDQEDAEDLLEAIEEELRQRRFAEVVRLEHGPHPDPWMLKFLMEELELIEEDIYETSSLLDFTDLGVISDVNLPKLKFDPYTPVVAPAFAEDGHGMFNAIKMADQLVHHPYESFAASVEKFIRVASEDPKVLAIKMTLYRTGDNSPFIRSLIRAAEQGKQVVCLVELKARFDEERNIYWATELENAGVHVVYGVVGLKTHAKTALVVRQEQEGLRCYCHIGTGNYNVATSRFYTDLGLLTAREEITNDVVEFFHYLTGRSLKSNYQNLLIAPVNMFSRFKSMIEREAEHAKAGRPAQIIAKFNNFEENDIAVALYAASQKGVDIEMIVRGFCCLRPGVPGMSERIRVTSIIGRFLEHSRIFYFRNGEKDPVDGEFYLGSADWMYRNLHARVEAIVPILDRSLKEKCWEILSLCVKEQRQSWEMKSDGTYVRQNSQDVGLHQTLMQIAKARVTFVDENTSSSTSSNSE
ncbi:polyphosphate kinase 1 [Bdellovibrio bacteriovorus]|uniref:Polyphosphate kinase n=1 Tax=Bdellovibrio bacteriovorus (strain ATCC 15356 / DSM 50701 / NCIMB 9529 / HD100) TaxID=264462 RepID=Q6MP55_BDEBA|nr:polyphosphate kinase 1 [Bdellovibrio bacteriovorus]CAE78943.1 ppk [Bdellovibrio bacteriovorus HD100]